MALFISMLIRAPIMTACGAPGCVQARVSRGGLILIEHRVPQMHTEPQRAEQKPRLLREDICVTSKLWQMRTKLLSTSRCKGLRGPSFQLLWVSAEERDCGIVRYECVQFDEKPPNRLAKHPKHFASPPAVSERSRGSPSSPALGVVGVRHVDILTRSPVRFYFYDASSKIKLLRISRR